MSDEVKPIEDPGKPAQRKTEVEHLHQLEQIKARLARREGEEDNRNSIAFDDTYGELHEENRVVMRHTIALNIDSFRATPDNFAPRPLRSFPPLQEVVAPTASVIVPNYNSAHLLPLALEALQGQSVRDFETIVVSDARTGGSITVVADRYPNVRFITNQHGGGIASACNTGAAAARGKILILLDPAILPEADWLKELIRAVIANPQAAIVTSKILFSDRRNTLFAAGDLLGVDGVLHNRGEAERDRGQFDSKPQVFGGCRAATAYRRDVWQALGGFDEEFGVYLEDVDYAFRVRLAGLGAILTPLARAYQHPSTSNGAAETSYYAGRNTLWLLVKNMPRGLLLRNAGVLLRGQLSVTLAAVINIRGHAARARLCGQFMGLLGLPRQLQKRRAIQLRRQITDTELVQLLMR